VRGVFMSNFFTGKVAIHGDKIEEYFAFMEAAEIINSLKIDMFDERFCRKEVSDRNPLNDFVMLPSSFIVHKNQLH